MEIQAQAFTSAPVLALGIIGCASAAFAKVNDSTYRGSVKDFVDNGLKVNGQFIDQVGLSVFGRYGMLKVVGQRKPARGKPAAIYEIDTKVNSMFSFGG